MTVTVDYEKAERPTRLTDLRVTINLPHASCQDREAAIRRVAEHCPVHQTMMMVEGVQFVLFDRNHPAPAPDESPALLSV